MGYRQQALRWGVSLGLVGCSLAACSGDDGGGPSEGANGGSGAVAGTGGMRPNGGSGGGPWTGVECEPPESGAVRPYFEVPGTPRAELADFFRLPFPNDVRRNAAGVDLAGFPAPGAGLLGVDPVALYVDALEASESSWSSDPTVFFRFSGELAAQTLRAGSSLRFVDLTDSAAVDGASPELVFHYSRERSRYVCDNWLGVRRPAGAPLLSGHTYAVWIGSEVTAADGTALEPAHDFQRLLADAKPKETALARAYDAYAPLRDYLDQQSIDPSSLLTAAVFSVGNLQSTMSSLADLIEREPAPALAADWVSCAAGIESPCPDRSGTRACGPASSAYDEYHALLTLPSYQRGAAPFLRAADGGDIDLAEPPTPVDVCVAVTVPKAKAPAKGFPLVVFAHGTGGSFRSHVSESVAGALASGEVKFAVLGIDQVSHGTRRAGSTAAPDSLFFNFLNPAAARGNPLQGAVDQLWLARFAETLDGTGKAPFRIDPERLVFLGHSQGATEGSLAAPYAERYRAMVLSGNGGSLQRALLTKSKPVDLRATLPLLLSDVPFDDMAAAAEYHPVLSLIQHWIDPADPLNFARHVALEPLPGHSPRHTFQTYGLDDTYSPPLTLGVYALAGGFAQVAPELDSLGLEVVAPPLAGNLQGVTLGFRQYQPPAGEDGHFVAFSVAEASADVLRFFSMAVSGETPAIGE
jgi:hypothetical protein